ncbi:MAG: NADH-quinone oxidoreductase subunit G, partial [Alphaproteobacteria bacterium]|nr:NADH-quinone oxidoreductase subunit G [Alphaproteobacteria bacterium]
FDILGQDVLGQDVMGFDTLDALRTKLYAQVPHLAQIDCRPEAVALTAIETDGILSDTPLASTISNFDFTNPIARASAIMADCDKERQTTSREAAE